MNVLSFTGWSQSIHTFDRLYPPHYGIEYLNYAEIVSFKMDFFLRHQPFCDVVLSWSLSAPLVMQLIAEKLLQPKLLILIAAPASLELPGLAGFQSLFQASPSRALEKLQSWVSEGDRYQQQIAAELKATAMEYPHANLRYWLEYLTNFQLKDFAETHFPTTMILHGTKDKVIPVQHAHDLSRFFTKRSLHVFTESGHAPHLHNPTYIWQLIYQGFQHLM